MTCWNCQAETHAAPFCPACGRIAARAPGATHFDAFALPRGVDVDVPALEKAYCELSLKLHPDRFSHAEARERRLSLEQTTALNEAYKVLRDPVRRAFYVLKLAGVDLEREEGGNRGVVPMDFLEEVMELREGLEGARAKKDLDGAQAMGEEVRRRQQASLARAQEALRRHAALGAAAAGAAAAGGGTGGAQEALDMAALELGRVRYFTRFLEEVAAMEEEALG